jgi:hypothetical protein
LFDCDEVKRRFMDGVTTPLFEMLERGNCHGDIRPANICVKEDPAENLKFMIIDWDQALATTETIDFGSGNDARYPGYSSKCYLLHTAAQLGLIIFYLYLCNTKIDPPKLSDIEAAVSQTSIDNWWHRHPQARSELHDEFLSFVNNSDQFVQDVIESCYRQGNYEDEMAQMNEILKREWTTFINALLRLST